MGNNVLLIKDMPFSEQTKQSLIVAGIATSAQLDKYNDAGLLKIPGIGRREVKETDRVVVGGFYASMAAREGL